MNKPSLHSPKIKFRASISYSKALSEIGSSSTAMGMTLEDVKTNASFYTEQSKRNNATSKVVVSENKKDYPSFDWQEVLKYEA